MSETKIAHETNQVEFRKFLAHLICSTWNILIGVTMTSWQYDVET